MEPGELETIHRRVLALPDAPARARLTRQDWLGAVGVFLIVFLTTFPVAIPFLIMSHAHAALRVSNAIAVAMLFISGYAFGAITGARGWVVGIAMVVLGVALVGMTMALGG
jgi:VIT1/CCC1 family predicted Fe2+/Mn2+ transporter